jgi:hypothetical protein
MEIRFRPVRLELLLGRRYEFIFQSSSAYLCLVSGAPSP